MDIRFFTKWKYAVTLAVALASAGAANAIPISTDILFQTSNQSQFGSGSNISKDVEFFSFKIDKSFEKDLRSNDLGFKIEDANEKKSVDARFALDARVKAGVDINPGTVDVSYPVNINLDLPDEYIPGQKVTGSSSYTTTPGSVISSQFADANARLFMDARAIVDAQIKACAPIPGKADCKSMLKLDQDLGFSGSLLGISTTAGLYSDAVPIPGIFDLPLRLPVGRPTFSNPQVGVAGYVQGNFPVLNLSGGILPDQTLRANSATQILGADIDIDRMLTEFAGLPSFEGRQSASFGFNGVNFSGGINYNFLDFDLFTYINLEQNFLFDPTVQVSLVGSDGASLTTFNAGDNFEFILPTDVNTFEVTPVFSIDNIFRNVLSLEFGGTIDALLLELGGNLSVSGLGGVSKSFNTGRHSYGTSSPNVLLADTSFSLGGFNTFSGQSFSLTAAQSVPEPSTWLLYLAGLGLLIGLRVGGINTLSPGTRCH